MADSRLRESSSLRDMLWPEHKWKADAKSCFLRSVRFIAVY